MKKFTLYLLLLFVVLVEWATCILHPIIVAGARAWGVVHFKIRPKTNGKYHHD